MALAEEVHRGLSSPQKFIPSRFFYDAKGDVIFQSIMRMPEYYLTRSEYEILSSQTQDILNALKLGQESFDLIEFGAGDGFKTKVLIERLMAAKAKFRYVPVDISINVLKSLKSNFEKIFPKLEIIPQNAEYFEALQAIEKSSDNPKLILFLGSNIGNFDDELIHKFLNQLYEIMEVNDYVLIGFDLKKNPHTILSAYNDKQGITKAFNLNVLKRINRELQADFDLEHFEHYPTYDPITGYAKSFLVSLKKQTVTIKTIGKSFHFEMGETIHTEISRKFTVDQINNLLIDASFEVLGHFYDYKHYFVDTLIQKKKKK